MIYILTALGAEARPLIGALHLKKKETKTRFRLYEDEEQSITLAVTGVGSIVSAAAVGMLIGSAKVDEENFLISFGCCAGLSGMESGSGRDCDTDSFLYIGDKLLNLDSGRIFYPDLLIRENFPEAEIRTGSRVLNRTSDLSSDPSMKKEKYFAASENAGMQSAPGTVLYDMESAAVYEAGSNFLGPHDMSFLRVVTDYGSGENVTASDVERCVRSVLPDLLRYIEQVGSFLKLRSGKGDPGKNEETYERLESDLKCSETMKHQLRQLGRYCVAAGIPWEDRIKGLYDAGILPAKDRKVGKAALTKLRGEF